MTLESLSWHLLEARVGQLGLIGTGEGTQPLLSGGIAFIETGAGSAGTEGCEWAAHPP